MRRLMMQMKLIMFSTCCNPVKASGVIWTWLNKQTCLVWSSLRGRAEPLLLLLQLLLQAWPLMSVKWKVNYWHFLFYTIYVPISLSLIRKKNHDLKKSRRIKLVKSKNSISRKIFWPNSIFCSIKNGQKSIFLNW